MKPRRHLAEIPLRHENEANPVPIVADGAMGTALLGEGRMIPVLILDTSARPDVEKLITSQYWSGMVGDATSIWSFSHEIRRPRHLKRRAIGLPWPLLLLTFTKPSRCLLIVEFDIRRQGVLVDQVLWSHGVYLQAGRPGDRLARTVKNPKILVEVPPNEVFRGEFERVYMKAIYRNFRGEGMSRAHAKHAAKAYLKEWRDVFQRRIPFQRPPSQDTVPGSPADAPKSDSP